MVVMSNNQGYANKKSDVADFYSGRSVFVTGGTGFLGKVLIEKLLYSCKDIDKIYVLIREKKGVQGIDRISNLINSSVFDRVKQQKPECIKKLVPLLGNITHNDLGLKTEDLKLLKEVSVIFHVAASIGFKEPLNEAMAINAIGTENIIKLSHRIKTLQALVHVSTAYCNVDRNRIEEIVYPAPHTMDHALELAEKYSNNKYIPCEYIANRPNTYIYSKSIAEEIVATKRGSIPTAIVRPSIVTSSVREPCPGWIDNWNGATGAIESVIKGIARVLPAKSQCVVDVIPVDIVTNLIIVAATKCARTEELKVYNCCTGTTNPITIKQMISRILNISEKYSLHDIPFPFVLFASNQFLYTLLSFIFHILPAYILDCWLSLTGKKPKYMRIQEKVHCVFGVLKYFMCNQWDFSDTNVRDLLEAMSEYDKHIFGFDVTSWSWETYIEDYIFGIQKHLLKNVKA